MYAKVQTPPTSRELSVMIVPRELSIVEGLGGSSSSGRILGLGPVKENFEVDHGLGSPKLCTIGELGELVKVSVQLALWLIGELLAMADGGIFQWFVGIFYFVNDVC